LSHAPCRFTCHLTEPVKALDERSGHVHHGSAGTASYQDPLILIRDGTLTIQRYYLPTGAKRIRLTAIVGVEQYAMTRWTGKWRIWGTTLGRWWFNLDIGRPHKQQAFVIDLGRRVKPVLTPGDPEAFRAALATAGIPLATRTRGTGRRP